MAAQRENAKAFRYRPVISILTPTCNPPKEILQATIASVLAQTYDRWELCLADGRSTDPAVRQLLEEAAQADERIRVRFFDVQQGISHNSNACLELARGEFVALLDHDDLLAPTALYEVVRRLNEDPELDFLYSDKDLITEDGSRHFNPLFKPAWSPDIMLTGNYLTHFNVLRTERVRAAGGFRPETDGAQDWDLFFRVLEGNVRIAHIPEVLYHWRFWSRSTSAGLEAKPYARAAQLRTLNEHCRRSGRKGEVILDRSGFLRLRRDPGEPKSIAIIVHTDGTSGRLPALLGKIQQLEGEDPVRVVVAHTGLLPAPVRDYYEWLRRDNRTRIVVGSEEEAVAAVLNRAAEGQETDLLLFLKDWLDPADSDWLDELVAWVEQPGVGIVGGQVADADGTLLQGPLVLRRDGQVLPLFASIKGADWNCFGDTNWYRNCSAVGAACLLVRRDAFAQAGGFNPHYQQAGHDIELCCRVTAQGRRIVYNPFAKFLAPPREGRFIPAGTADRERLRLICESAVPQGDPYFSSHLADHSPRPLLRPCKEGLAAGGEREVLLPPVARADSEAGITWVQPDDSMHVARSLATFFDFSPAQRDASLQLQAANAGPIEIRSINWFIPEFTNAGYGGIHTILRLANHLRLHYGVTNRFYYLGIDPPEAIRASIVKCFPGLDGQVVHPVRNEADLDTLEYAHACVATLWSTAYTLLKFNRTRRKFYLLQDYEPLFYPAGTTSGQVEASYRFGFYGLANTRPLQEIYEREHGGVACHFMPAVDTSLFHPAPDIGLARRLRVFFYGRPKNPRNAFELGTEALRRVKQRLGGRVEILSAGEYWRPRDFGLQGVVDNLGVLTIQQTAELYRSCDLGLVLMLTRHPSYLPFELMASGCLVVTNRNAATTWLLRDRGNCLLVEPSIESIATAIEQGLDESALRQRIIHEAKTEIDAKYSDWKPQLDKLFAFMCDPQHAHAASLTAPRAA